MSTRGFTLLELVISISILAIALVVLISTHTSSIKMTAGVCRELSAFGLAKEKMAEAELMENLSSGKEDGVGIEGLKWERVTSPMMVLNEPAPNMIRVKVVVSDEGLSLAELVTYLRGILEE